MRTFLVLGLCLLATSAHAGSAKVIAQFSFTVPPGGTLQSRVLDTTKGKPTAYLVLGNCFVGSFPSNEPDPVIRYTPFAGDGEGVTGVCGPSIGVVAPIFAAPNSSVVFEGRFPGTITSGVTGGLVLQRMGELE
jgi:hypothetical protein